MVRKPPESLWYQAVHLHNRPKMPIIRKPRPTNPPRRETNIQPTPSRAAHRTITRRNGVRRVVIRQVPIRLAAVRGIAVRLVAVALTAGQVAAPQMGPVQLGDLGLAVEAGVFEDAVGALQLPAVGGGLGQVVAGGEDDDGVAEVAAAGVLDLNLLAHVWDGWTVVAGVSDIGVVLAVVDGVLAVEG